MRGLEGFKMGSGELQLTSRGLNQPTTKHRDLFFKLSLLKIQNPHPTNPLPTMGPPPHRLDITPPPNPVHCSTLAIIGIGNSLAWNFNVSMSVENFEVCKKKYFEGIDEICVNWKIHQASINRK